MSDERHEDELKSAMHHNTGTGRNFEDISRVLASWYVPPESYDDRNGVWLVEFNDGQRVAFFGWHDSSGWDCQSGLDLLPFETWEERLREDSDRGFSGAWAMWAGEREAIIQHIKQQLEASR